ncbi:MAG TPA: His-Xaa-Ser system protein HxsD [Gammaproteobacteria bacterium]|nr:His-Xaa-Ser system protein HxsD [Gammaproteobacteria bacterium]
MAPEERVPVSALRNVTARRERTEAVSLDAFTLDTVKKACYRFANRGFHKLSVDSKHRQVLVQFRFPASIEHVEEEDIVDRFHNEVLDQDLREKVRSQTEIIRNLILTNAFADSALVDDDC